MKHRHEWRDDGGAGSANDGQSCRACGKLKEDAWPYVLWFPAILVAGGLILGLILQ
jgi:hypothetical protein